MGDEHTTEEQELVKKAEIPFMAVGVEIYLGLKISKDGDSRKEDVDVLKGFYDENRHIRQTGAKVRYYLRKQQQELPDEPQLGEG